MSPLSKTPHSGQKSQPRSDSFPFPILIEHILTAWEALSHLSGAFVRSWTNWEAKGGGWKVRLDIGGNRWCMNKVREVERFLDRGVRTRVITFILSWIFDVPASINAVMIKIVLRFLVLRFPFLQKKQLSFLSFLMQRKKFPN